MVSPITGAKSYVYPNTHGRRVSINNLLSRVMLLVLNRCGTCRRPDGKPHLKQKHDYVRDASLPEWHGWHACRRGLGSNLYRLGAPDKVIQLILRHANVATTLAYTSSRVARMWSQRWGNSSKK
jgi:integrase